MTGFNKRNKHKADFVVYSVLGNMVTAHIGTPSQKMHRTSTSHRAGVTAKIRLPPKCLE